MARPQRLRGAQVEPARLEGLLDLLDRLAAEVRYRVELGLRLLHQVADRLHAGALEAVVRAYAQLELLDQDVVHPVGRAAATAAADHGRLGRRAQDRPPGRRA